MFHSRAEGEAPRPSTDPPAPSRPGDLSRLVREALERDRIQIEFQPVAMRAPSPGLPTHEGFIRILDGEGRVLPAGRFMGAVEESTLGRDLDCASLRLGLQALRAHPGLRLAVNASARSLGNGAWRATLDAGAREFAARLTLEIGEGSATLLADRVTRFMAELRPRGLSFVLDDFGSGPLSLRQLRDFGFDGVKIDRSCLRDIERSGRARTLVAALADVARRFGMYSIAKGVETEGQANCLHALGVDGMQGYLFGRPGPLP